MAYRNKTYVAFASEDLKSYNLMKAWKANAHIDFNFLDAHDINVALDTSKPDTIRTRLKERLANTKQSIVLIGDVTKTKASNSKSFLYYEIEVIQKLKLPVVFVNLDQARTVLSAKLPTKLAGDYYTMSVSFQPKIVMIALDDYVAKFQNNSTQKIPKVGAHLYKAQVYKDNGL